MAEQHEEWDVWYSKAGATGLSFARGRIGPPAAVMLVHAAPEAMTVTVRQNDQVVARGQDLKPTGETPIARLTRRGDQIEREDIWPSEQDVGRLVLLPGGEVGTLLHWWNAEDHSEWRWQIELYNHR